MGIKELQIYVIILFMIMISSCNDDSGNPNNNNTINDDVMDSDPSWSPNGNSIVYAGGYTNPNPGLYVIDTAGINKVQLLTKDVQYPEYSPDGQWILYQNHGDVFKMKIGSDSIVQLTFNQRNFFPSWSKDGEYIAFDSDFDTPNGTFHIWKMKKDGSDKKRIIDVPGVEVRHASWFPDGIRIAVVGYFPNHISSDIGIIDTIGNILLILNNDDMNDQDLKVSNDGNKIVYGRNINFGQVCIINADGSGFQIIVDKNSRTPNWSPWDNSIIYTNCTAGDGRLWVTDLSGQTKRKISY